MMPVEHLRIDNRLIHGQVVVTWVQAQSIDTLMVANDAIAGDDFQRAILLAVAPPSIKVLILTIEDGLAYVASPDHASDRIFILVNNPHDALRLFQGGLPLRTMNVGNMSFAAGAKRVSNTVFVTPVDVRNFVGLQEAGVELTCQMMPTDRSNDFMEMLTAAKLLPQPG